MKLKKPGQPSDSGWYALRRSVVLEVLVSHYVTVCRERENEEIYVLEKDDELFAFSLPSVVPAKMVFHLAITFDIPSEAFYQASNAGLH